MSRDQNALIAHLPRIDRARLLSVCEGIHLSPSQVLWDAGDRQASVLFPVDGFVSQVVQLPGHVGTVEVGMVGREGLVGAALALGVPIAPVGAVVQGAGLAWRLDAHRFELELQASEALRGLVQRYLYVTLVQWGTASACRSFHSLQERLARWLLMSQDRAHADEFRVTHEFMGLMLGVRREGVTVAAGELQSAGVIRYHRGVVRVCDRLALESRACACFAADGEVYRACLGPGHERRPRSKGGLRR